MEPLPMKLEQMRREHPVAAKLFDLLLDDLLLKLPPSIKKLGLGVEGAKEALEGLFEIGFLKLEQYGEAYRVLQFDPFVDGYMPVGGPEAHG